MALGKWGKWLKEKGFNERYYLGDYIVYSLWSMGEIVLDGYNGKEFTEQRYHALSTDEKGRLYKKFDAYARELGNCGELANYFLRYSSTQLSTPSDPVEFISEILTRNPNCLFRVTIGGSHTFIGIRSVDPAQEIEILQAWQGKYSVVDWLNRGNNVFSIEQFVTCLERLSNIHTLNEASNELFSAREQKLLLGTTVAKVTMFAFKPYDEGMDTILHGLQPFNPVSPFREADVYKWPSDGTTK